MIPLKHLPKSNFGSINNIHTFTSYCENNKSQLPTDAWLVPKKHISAMLSKIVTAYMNGEDFIVKIQDESINARKEMEIYETVSKLNHPNFAQLVCHFSCADNIMLYNRQTTLPKGFCTGGHNQVHLTIMPYYKLGTIDDFKLDQHQLASIIGQVILGYIEMYAEIGFIHNDLIPSNVSIETDDHISVVYNYDNEEYEVPLLGYRSIILDFGVASLENTEENLVVRDLILFIDKLFRVKSIDFKMEQFTDKKLTTISDLLKLAEQLKFIKRVKHEQILSTDKS